MKNALILVSFVLLFGLLSFGCAQQQAMPTVVPTVAPSSVPSTAPSLAASQAPSGGGEASVSISGFVFNPAELRVTAGTRVTWTNDDPAQHSIVSDSGSELNAQAFSQGASYSHVFASAGTFAYHCGIHASMHGTVIVS